MNFLFVIPARGGSKGIPHKNIKLLCGKELIKYSIDIARNFASDSDICVSTDDDDIIDIVEKYNLKVFFKRPDYLATDKCGTYEVLLHAISFYENKGRYYDAIVLLQPTSPFRSIRSVKEAIALYKDNIDMVVGVKEVSANPYFNCFEENENGYLIHSKGNGSIYRRQDVPKVFEYNGAVYIMNVSSLKQKPHTLFDKIIKYEMNEIESIDIDTPWDWVKAEYILKEHIVTLTNNLLR